jgi:hypothetical protein
VAKEDVKGLPKLLAVREMPEIQGVRVYLKGGNYRNGNKPVAAGRSARFSRTVRGSR